MLFRSYGEKMVMRILNSNSDMLSLDFLISNEQVREQLRSIINEPNGIIIVSGLTGSGKSTTLASALREKDTARMLVFNALQHPLYQEIETVVRVNPLESEFGLKDLHAVVRAGVNVVRLPKTDSAEDVQEMERCIEDIERVCGREVGSTKMMAAIESAQGVNNAIEIAQSSSRLIGIALGAEDYVRDLKTQRKIGRAHV